MHWSPWRHVPMSLAHSEQEEESDDAYRSSIAELTDRGAKLRGAKLGEFILKMRIPEFPFPITSGRLRGRCHRRPRVCDQSELNQEGPRERKTLCVKARTTAVSAASGPTRNLASELQNQESPSPQCRGGWGCTVAPCRSLLAARAASAARHADNFGAAHGKDDARAFMLPPGAPVARE